LYYRFGNFIGEVEESEDDSQHGVDAGAYVYDEYPEEEVHETTGQELMEVDGMTSTAHYAAQNILICTR
jgi:116 kDa U5 small nuclear ribonucleoprotein component